MLSCAPGRVGRPARSLHSLVGRERELALAQSLIRRSDVRLLTLTGPGGIGKTRLALQLAADLADDFADGVRFVPLAPSATPTWSPRRSPTRSASSRPAACPSSDALTVGAPARRTLLLVVDNFEHVLAAAPVVTDLLAACPRLKILVTSRALLRVAGEHALAVPPLTLPDPRRVAPPSTDLVQAAAVQLFAERAQAVDASFALTETTAPQVAEICRRLDGLPLAIELARRASAICRCRICWPDSSRRLPLLTGGSRDQPTRLQTMRNAIAWSHDLLTPEEQALFRRLAVFVGGFTLEAAEYVGGSRSGSGSRRRDPRPRLRPPRRPRRPRHADRRQPAADRASAADGAARYRMLETIREFALERLAASGEEAAIRRAPRRLFLALAERYELADLLPDGDRILAVLEAEHANLRAALAWLEEAGEAGPFLRLAAALGRFWSGQGHYQEGRAWLERAAGAGSAAAGADRAKALVHLGMIEALPGANREAETRLTEGLAGCRDAGRRVPCGTGADRARRAGPRQGDHDRGTALLEEAIAAAQTVADPRLAGIMAGWALINLAVVARGHGDLALAAERLEAATPPEREAGYTDGDDPGCWRSRRPGARPGRSCAGAGVVPGGAGPGAEEPRHARGHRSDRGGGDRRGGRRAGGTRRPAAGRGRGTARADRAALSLAEPGGAGAGGGRRPRRPRRTRRSRRPGPPAGGCGRSRRSPRRSRRSRPAGLRPTAPAAIA